MSSLKYFLYLCLMVASTVQANPAASNVVRSSKVDIGFNKLRIKLGKSAFVTCNPGGSPLPTIEWTKDGGPFAKGTAYTGNTLMISAAKINDGGIYRCLGKVNRKIVAEQTIEVQIVDEGKVSEKTLYLERGQTGFVDCISNGNPLPTVLWTKGHGPLGSNNKKEGTKLVIYKAQDIDAGVYVCHGILDGESVWTDFTSVIIRNPASSPSARIAQPHPVTSPSVPVPQIHPVTSPSVPVLQTHPATSPSVPVLQTHPVTSPSVPVLQTHPATSPSVPVLQTHPVTSPSVPVLRTYPVSSYPVHVASGVKVHVQKLEIVKGQSGAVACFGVGSPLPIVQWRKTDGVIGSETRQDGNVLIISNAQKSDGGSYECHGDVNGVTVGTQNVEVKIKAEGAATAPLTSTSPKVFVNARELKIVRGQSGAVDCYPTGSPAPKVEWTKDGSTFSTGTFKSGNTLVISNADENDGGVYLCHGLVGSKPVWTDFVTVQIVEATDNHKSAFEITILNGDSKIRCEPEFVEEAPADSGKAVVHTPNGLAILIEHKTNSEGYTCKVVVGKDSLALRQANLALEKLTAPEPPQVIVRPESTNAAVGQAVFVDCVVVKGDGVRVHWERVNGSVASHAEARGSRLIFHRVEAEDAGKYRCVAKNGGGEVSQSTQITVQEPVFEKDSPHAPLVRVLETVVEVPIGQTCKVKCKPYGLPLPTVQWINAEGTSSDFTQEDNDLVIRNADFRHTGNYVCNALVESTPVWTDSVQIRVYDLCTEAKDEGYWSNDSTERKYYRDRYYYDSNDKKCSQFYYKGHGGTRNNFLSLASCKYFCEH